MAVLHRLYCSIFRIAFNLYSIPDNCIRESSLWLSGWSIGLVVVQPGFNSQPCMGFFLALIYTFSCCKMMALYGIGFYVEKKWFSIIINDDFLEEVVGECYDQSLSP